MELNKRYYQELNKKYNSIKTLPNDLNDSFLLLTLKIIMDCIGRKQSIHINFQNNFKALQTIGKLLFVELANDIYLKYVDLPKTIEKGNRFKNLKTGKTFEVSEIKNNRYTLKEILKGNQTNRFPIFLPGRTYDTIITDFIRIKIGVSDNTIKNYLKFFDDLNDNKTEFPRTIFYRKSIFIGQKIFYDSLEVKNRIPITYFPNPREENIPHEIKSIPALPDSIMYFTTRYEICYQKILQHEKIEAIVIYDTEEDNIEQIVYDKNRFGYNLILLTNSLNPIKSKQIPCWNWFKEETEIIHSL